MAHYFLYPSKDATIFSAKNRKLQNSGKDEILEIEKSYEWDDSTDTKALTNTRSLLHFNILPEISNLPLEDFLKYKFTLNLKVTEVKEIPLKYSILAFPISQSWDMGVGRKYDNYTTDGVTWKYRKSPNDPNSFWISGSSLTDASGGGTWIQNGISLDSVGQPTNIEFMASQSFEFQKADIKMDITHIVRAWYTQSIENHGLILMHNDENSNHDYQALRFFSMDTNTIYAPYIDIMHDDSIYDTGSLTVITGSKVVKIQNLRESYVQGENDRIDVFAREYYPIKTFSHVSNFQLTKALPHTTYYAIRDAETEETWIPFDEYTKLSCDPFGNYFYLNTSGLAQERYYTVSIKVVENNKVSIFNLTNKFKIRRT